MIADWHQGRILKAEQIDFAAEFESRLGWRKPHSIEWLAELGGFASVGLDTFRDYFSQLRPYLHIYDKPTALDALATSIERLWHEAVYCYMYELFEPCILTCGAVVERALKFEFERQVGATGERWTIGRTIQECRKAEVISDNILELAECIADPRNDRSHANLERTNPDLAQFGGDRGVTILSDRHYLINPYQQNSRATLDLTLLVLKELFA